MSDIFTTGQIAKMCLVSPRTVNKWFDSGRLRGYRTSEKQIRQIPRANLIRFLQENGLPLGELEADFAPVRRRAAHLCERARLLIQHGQFAQAIDELDRAVLMFWDERTIRLRGLVHHRLGNDNKAVDDLTEALNHRWDKRLLRVRARLYYRQGRYDLALSDLHAVIRADHKAEAAYRLRARIHRLLARQDSQRTDELAGRRKPRP